VLPEPECSWSVGGDRARDKSVVLPQNHAGGDRLQMVRLKPRSRDPPLTWHRSPELGRQLFMSPVASWTETSIPLAHGSKRRTH